MKSKLELTTIGQIVAGNYNAARVFAMHDIDFCCGGGVTLAKACEAKKLDMNSLLEELELVFREKVSEIPDGQNLVALIDSIIDLHHRFIRTTAPAIVLQLEKLCRVHGELHPELFEVLDLFREGCSVLEEHMRKEEMVLFPYIKAMAESEKAGFTISKPHFGHIENPIQCMKEDHEAEGARFKTISKLTNNYTCPTDACQTYMVTYALLKDFEMDLHKHIHLENNILFPTAQNLFELIDFQ